MTVDDNKRPYCVRLVWIISRKNKKVVHLKDLSRQESSHGGVLFNIIHIARYKEHEVFQKNFDLFHDFSGSSNFKHDRGLVIYRMKKV